jgi:hypothetical protein
MIEQTHVPFPAPHDELEVAAENQSRALEVTESRRTVVRRLAALGLAAACGTSLSSLDAEAKRKPRGRRPPQGKGRKRTMRQRGGLNASALTSGGSVTKVFLYTERGPTAVKITMRAQGELSSLAVNAIKAGTATYKLRFILWEEDDELFDATDDALWTEFATLPAQTSYYIGPSAKTFNLSYLASWGHEYYVGVRMFRYGDNGTTQVDWNESSRVLI